MRDGWARGDLGKENLMRVFEEHEEEVRRVVPRERLLVYRAEEGWGPLCEFLGRERPVGVRFPRVNERGGYVRGFRRARDWVVLKVVVRGLVVVGVPLVAVLWAWWVMF